jgi:hypothetical protein
MDVSIALERDLAMAADVETQGEGESNAAPAAHDHADANYNLNTNTVANDGVVSSPCLPSFPKTMRRRLLVMSAMSKVTTAKKNTYDRQLYLSARDKAAQQDRELEDERLISPEKIAVRNEEIAVSLRLSAYASTHA